MDERFVLVGNECQSVVKDYNQYICPPYFYLKSLMSHSVRFAPCANRVTRFVPQRFPLFRNDVRGRAFKARNVTKCYDFGKISAKTSKKIF